MNGRHVLEGFVNTGSSVCTIRESAAMALNLNVKGDAQPLYSYGGQENAAAIYAIGKTVASIAITGMVAEDVGAFDGAK